MDKLLIYTWKIIFVTVIVVLFLKIVGLNLKIPY